MHAAQKRKYTSPHHEGKGAYNLSGQLTARSHILRTNPQVVILEVCTSDASENIVCNKANFVLLRRPLIIGQHYSFSKLHLTALKIKSKNIRCYRMTDKTSWEETEATVDACPSCNDFTNLQGRVTKIDDEVGILFLKSIPVIFISCSLVAKIPRPKKDQRIHIFNVHRINDISGQVIVYAMCAKSYLRILDEDEDEISDPNNSVMSSLGSNAPRGFKFVLWLQNCFNKVRKDLNEDFLVECGVLRSDYLQFYINVVKSIVSLALKKLTVPERSSVLAEFLAPDHNSHCCVLREEIVPCSIINLLELDKEYPPLEEDEDCNGSKIFWQFDVKQDLKNLLIGVILVKNTSHRLTFNNSSGSLYCLMTPEQEHSPTHTDMGAFNRKVVVFIDPYLIRERFTWTEGDQLCTQTYKCLVVHPDQVSVMSSLTSGQNNSDSVPTISSEGNASVGENYCISPLKEPPLKEYLAQHIVVQHKAMTSVPEQGKPARCYLLVLVHGEMMPNTSANVNSRKNTSVPLFISLQGPLLSVRPFIAVNAAYEIRFPTGFDVDFFRKGTPLSRLLSLRTILPTINCVTLPSCCEMYTLVDNPIPPSVMKYSDCYGINECLEMGSNKEFINIMGYVVGRFHQDPKFEREKQSVKANGFGVPGGKVMAIVLRDHPPESQVGSPITLYLSYWASLQYPIGLLPGSRVVFRFVTRVVGQEHSIYLRSSILTSFEVLELPHTGENDEKRHNQDIWGPRSALGPILEAGSKCCQWLTVSMVQIHRISFTASCSTCSHDYQNGSCTFAGCSTSTAPRILAQISFLIEEFKSSSALVFVPDSLVSKLFNGSEDLLSSLSKLTKKYGQLRYYRYQSSEDVCQLPIEQRVFRLLCKSIFTNNRFHLLCRRFNKAIDSQYQTDLQILYAVDINPVALLVGVS